jgi:chromosome segregation ATPase
MFWEQIPTLLQIVLVFFASIAGSWLVYRGKLREYESAVEVARETEKGDILLAHTELQVELAKAAENLVAPLNRQLEQTKKISTLQQAEIDELRVQLREKDRRIVAVETENGLLRGKIQVLELERADLVARVDDLQNKIENIKKAVDTGELKL